MATTSKIDKKDMKKLQNDLFTIINYSLLFEEKSLDKNILGNLTLKEIHILDSINREPKKPMTYYALYWKQTLGAFMTCVKQLETKGYIEKVVDEEDRRITRLVTTKKASKALKEHSEFHDDLTAQLLKKCNAKSLMSVLSNFAGIIEENYKPTKTELNMMNKEDFDNAINNIKSR